MVQAGAYFDALDWLDQLETIAPQGFLSRVQVAYETGPITYLDVVSSNGRLRTQRIFHSKGRDPRMVARLLHRKRSLDQLLKLFSALEPVELDFRRGTERGGDLLLGLPLPARPGHHSCLLVDIGSIREDIRTWRRDHDRDLLSLGAMFNARLARSSRLHPAETPHKQLLTRRERETLAWIAAGKSYWETAVILGISERTIRHFMANVRQKLDVVNNAQAVAEAVWRNLIPRLAE